MDTLYGFSKVLSNVYHVFLKLLISLIGWGISPDGKHNQRLHFRVWVPISFRDVNSACPATWASLRAASHCLQLWPNNFRAKRKPSKLPAILQSFKFIKHFFRKVGVPGKKLGILQFVAFLLPFPPVILTIMLVEKFHCQIS